MSATSSSVENAVTNEAELRDLSDEAESTTRPSSVDRGSGRFSTGTASKDRYGFLLTDEFHQHLNVSSQTEQERRQKEQERSRKWVKMVKNWTKYYKIDKQKGGKKVTRRARKGIPDAVRGVAWFRLCGASTIRSYPEKLLKPLYDSAATNVAAENGIDTDSAPVHNLTSHLDINLSQLPQQVIDEIDRDVDRTFPRHEMFCDMEEVMEAEATQLQQRHSCDSTYDDTSIPRQSPTVSSEGDGVLVTIEDGKIITSSTSNACTSADHHRKTHVGQHSGLVGQATLRLLLQKYAVLDPAVGYCQGMGFIAGMLLTYMTPDDAFYAFYAVLTRASAPLRLLYLPRLIETQKVLFVFEGLGKQHLGALWQHLEQENMHPTMYFTEWIMTMFTRGFSFDLVTRVWDVFMSEGTFKIVYRVSLALVKCLETELMALSFEKIMALMRELPRHVDAEHVMDVAWGLPLKTAHIERLEELYRIQCSSSSNSGLGSRKA